MCKKNIFFIILSLSITTLASYKPPLQKGALIKKNLPVFAIENNDLRARPLTVVDLLNEGFEDRITTLETAAILQVLNMRNDTVINRERQKYLDLIEQAKKQDFNKSAAVISLINRYKRKIPSLVRDDFFIQNSIESLIESLGGTTKDRRREREDEK